MVLRHEEECMRMWLLGYQARVYMHISFAASHIKSACGPVRIIMQRSEA
jgi:hypothetical protein